MAGELLRTLSDDLSLLKTMTLRILSRSLVYLEVLRPQKSLGEIGLDDWAYRRRYRYGAIVVDHRR